MTWDPSATDLGTVNENVNISHSITYTDEMAVVYPVVVTANELNSNTIVISGNTITGYYIDSFNNTIRYRNPDGTFSTVNKFSEINIEKLYQMISYKASTSLSRVYTYTAKAMNGTIVVATQTYSKTVTNDWTSGKNSLQYYVGVTA